jgi:hypothetical protein
VKYIITLFIFIFIFSLSAQAQDITGVWTGSSNFLKTQYHVQFEFKQAGNKLEAIEYFKTLDKKDSAKAIYEGTIKDGLVHLKPIRFEYTFGLSCLAQMKMTLSEEGNSASLTGTWFGDMSLKTCAPLTSGNISVVKSQPIQIVSTSQPDIKNTTNTNSLHTIGDEDKIGQALINELSKRKYYALIIGINDYTDEQIQTLDNPVKDAQSLAQVLKTYYSFDKEDVLVLSNPNRAKIIDAMDALSTKVTERDNLLIFYAGHGIWNEQLNQGYWLPSNAALSSKADWLSNSTIRDYLRGINSKHTLLISDACFSGGILKERAVFENSRAILEVYRLPSRKAMTSGTLKTVPDQSVFIEYLLKNLIQNKSPLMSADQLFRQFKTAVINNSPNGQVPQYGPISQAGDEGGDFVFLRKE